MHSERRLQPVLALAIVLLFAMLLIRTYLATSTDRKLCNVIYTLVARSGATVGKPGSPGYSYYHDHPAELAKARKQNHDFLRQLPCKK